MQRLNRITLLMCACCIHLFSKAQTISCSADFSYSTGYYYNAVNFFAKDSLGTTQHWTFGDGTPMAVSTNGMETHQYAKPGKYEVKHFIEKPNANCRDSVVKIINVEWTDQCNAGYYYQKDSAKLSWHFFNNSQAYSDIKKTHWSFGDGSFSDSLNPVHTFAKSGTYNVCLQIETSSGCTSQHCEQLPFIDSIGSCILAVQYQYHRDGITCKKIYFNNISSPLTNNVHFTWNFGDGTSSHDLNPVHEYAQAGKFYVCLVAEAGANCRKVYCDSVTAACYPCDFTLSYDYRKDSTNCRQINFTSKSGPAAATNTDFIWNFGDGTVSHDINPSHVYTQTGQYRVCLVSETGSNCRKEYCDTINVICDSICSAIARFEWRKDSSDCKKIYFANYSEHLAPNTKFAWKFGDGSGSDNANPSHTYNQPGIYQVCLVVTGANNCTKYYCDSVIALCPDFCTIKPSFSWKTTDSAVNKVSFTNLTVTSTTAVHYIWNFGDSSSSRDINPSHVYTQPGKYTVCLVAESNTCRKEVCMQIEIKACNITARFEKQRPAAKWNTVYFSNVSSPVNNIWQTYWTYGDGASSRYYNSFHEYNQPGIYNVCLKVISLNGCTSQYCDTVRIVKMNSCAVNGKFSHYNSTSGSSNIKFEALYQSNTATYNWNFGDSSAGNGRIVYHNYTRPGKYNVCVTVKDGNCFVTYCETITVEQSLNGGRIAIFPNPAVNSVSIDVKLDVPEQLSIRFMDGGGAVRSLFSRSGVSGNNRYTLPVEKLSQGLYMVEIKSSTGVWYSRFVKG